MSDQVEIHNQMAGDLVGQIIRGTIGQGGTSEDALVLTESVLVGVSLALIRLGGDEKVLDAMTGAAKQRLAEIRLKETKGSA